MAGDCELSGEKFFTQVGYRLRAGEDADALAVDDEASIGISSTAL